MGTRRLAFHHLVLCIKSFLLPRQPSGPAVYHLVLRLSGPLWRQGDRHFIILCHVLTHPVVLGVQCLDLEENQTGKAVEAVKCHLQVLLCIKAHTLFTTGRKDRRAFSLSLQFPARHYHHCLGSGVRTGGGRGGVCRVDLLTVTASITGVFAVL